MMKAKPAARQVTRKKGTLLTCGWLGCSALLALLGVVVGIVYALRNVFLYRRLVVSLERFALAHGGQSSAKLAVEVRAALDAMKMDFTRQVDLSEALFAALYAAHIALYSTLKASLSRADTVINNKQAAETQAISFGVYAGVQELLRLAPAPSSDGRSLVSPVAHLKLDLAATGMPYSLPPLASAIRYRLCRLVPALVGIGGDTGGAFEAAVVAGDDASIAVILAMRPSATPSLSLARRAAELWGDSAVLARRLALASTGRRQAAIDLPVSNAFFRQEAAPSDAAESGGGVSGGGAGVGGGALPALPPTWRPRRRAIPAARLS